MSNPRAFGYIRVSTDQRTLCVLQECRAAGYSLRATADELNRLGLTTRVGTQWKHQYVASAERTTARG